MKKYFLFLLLSVFLSISFASVRHFHADSETGTKEECPLCVFLHAIPVLPSPHIIALLSGVIQEMIFFPAVIAVVSFLFILPDPRGPPRALCAV
jgi:hypothetical protein